jgi:hypothetical protein
MAGRRPLIKGLLRCCTRSIKTRRADRPRRRGASELRTAQTRRPRGCRGRLCLAVSYLAFAPHHQLFERGSAFDVNRSFAARRLVALDDHVDVERIKLDASADPSGPICGDKRRARTKGMGRRGFVTPASACWTLLGALAKGHEEDQLRRISVPARGHTSGDLALSPVHAQLS